MKYFKTAFALALTQVFMCLSVVQALEINEQLRIRGKLQTGWQLNGDLNSGSWSDSIYVQRARIDGRWTPFDWSKLNLELELADGESVEVRDAYIAFELDKALEITLGRFKKPFSRLRMMSPWELWVPERGLLDQRVVDDTPYGGFGARDLGLMVSGSIKGPQWLNDELKFSYDMGLFNNMPGDSGAHRDWVTRAQLRLFKGLVLAANSSVKWYEKSGSFKQALMIGADLKWEWQDLTIQLEGASGDNVNNDARLWGSHLIVAYTLPLPFSILDQNKVNVIPALMFEAYDPDTSVAEDLDLRLAAALNLDLNPQVRLILSAEQIWEDIYATSNALPDPLSVKLQSNLVF